jgi:hypothetical protein
MTYAAEAGKNSTALHHFSGLGVTLHFQDGPIGEQGVNGTSNEEVIQILVDRLTSFQQMGGGQFACKENACAITHLQEALHWLEARTKARVKRGVEGTFVP